MTSWRDNALCKGTPISWWYPTENSPGRPRLDGANLTVPLVTKQYCDACPVRVECRAYALEHELYGVWAGLSGRERMRLRDRLRIALVTPGVPWHALRDPTDDELAAIEAEPEELTA